ncbi:hypothetical protein BpHYR1_052377 [Brachionus plicatilis]|uniref:Uncharacterized protein n=1 Tax=Brachionus plicatilis TaxID=10195 RepID=A0A3M7PBP0_BRAPC|nr:hypothetical protein BpHYR1_052377 [Brachionus plicatilis]
MGLESERQKSENHQKTIARDASIPEKLIINDSPPEVTMTAYLRFNWLSPILDHSKIKEFIQKNLKVITAKYNLTDHEYFINMPKMACSTSKICIIGNVISAKNLVMSIQDVSRLRNYARNVRREGMKKQNIIQLIT